MEQEEEFYILESTDNGMDGVALFGMFIVAVFIGACILFK